jgi:hypothetical protein
MTTSPCDSWWELDSVDQLYRSHDEVDTKAVLVEEKMFVSSFINTTCANDPILKLKHVPLRPDPENVFVRAKDGLIFATMLNNAREGCVDMASMTTKSKLSLSEKQSNINIVLSAASSVGCAVNEVSQDALMNDR